MRRMSVERWNAWLLAQKMLHGTEIHVRTDAGTKWQVTVIYDTRKPLPFNVYPPNLWPKKRTKADIENGRYPVIPIAEIKRAHLVRLERWLIETAKRKMEGLLDRTVAEQLVWFAVEECPQVFEIVKLSHRYYRADIGGKRASYFVREFRRALNRLANKADTKLRRKTRDAHHRSTTGKRRPVSAHRQPRTARRCSTRLARSR